MITEVLPVPGGPCRCWGFGVEELGLGLCGFVLGAWGLGVGFGMPLQEFGM